MTESVAKWLEGWAGDGMQVLCECTELKPGRMGVYRKGCAGEQEYPDGTNEKTYRFGIELCFWAQSAADRVANLAALRGLEEWIRQQDVEENFPDVGGECWRAELAGGFVLKKSGLLECVYGAALDLYVTE